MGSPDMCRILRRAHFFGGTNAGTIGAQSDKDLVLFPFVLAMEKKRDYGQSSGASPCHAAFRLKYSEELISSHRFTGSTAKSLPLANFSSAIRGRYFPPRRHLANQGRIPTSNGLEDA